jgi:hypothetical protein
VWNNILFASPHCLIDFSSGAAIATRDALALLSQSGFQCEGFCASKLDLTEDANFEQILADVQIPVQVRELTLGSFTEGRNGVGSCFRPPGRSRRQSA